MLEKLFRNRKASAALGLAFIATAGLAGYELIGEAQENHTALVNVEGITSIIDFTAGICLLGKAIMTENVSSVPERAED